MKFKWLEPLKAKRAREGGFADIFRRKSFYVFTGVFIMIFILLWLVGDAEPGNARPPFAEVFFPLLLVAVSVSFLVNLILWIFPATIIVNEEGVFYKMGEGSSLDKWADISDVRIEQRAGWKALAFTVKGKEQREWGISPKVSAQGLLNFIQRQA